MTDIPAAPAVQNNETHTGIPYLIRSVWTYRILRFVLAGIFIYAGAVKLADIRGFALVIEEYGIIYGNLAVLVAFCLPMLEVAAGTALVFDIRGSLAAVTGMAIFFFFLLGYALFTGLTIADCGCFAPGELPDGIADGSAIREAFYRDIGLLFICAYLYWWRYARADRANHVTPVRHK